MYHGESAGYFNHSQAPGFGGFGGFGGQTHGGAPAPVSPATTVPEPNSGTSSGDTSTPNTGLPSAPAPSGMSMSGGMGMSMGGGMGGGGGLFGGGMGGGMMNNNTVDPRKLKAIELIKAEAKKLWQCGPRESIMVNELRCNEPGCPPIETVIIRKNGQEKTQVKVFKPIVEVTYMELVDAVLGHPLEGEEYEEGCLCGDADCGDELSDEEYSDEEEEEEGMIITNTGGRGEPQGAHATADVNAPYQHQQQQAFQPFQMPPPPQPFQPQGHVSPYFAHQGNSQDGQGYGQAAGQGSQGVGQVFGAAGLGGLYVTRQQSHFAQQYAQQAYSEAQTQQQQQQMQQQQQQRMQMHMQQMQQQQQQMQQQQQHQQPQQPSTGGGGFAGWAYNA